MSKPLDITQRQVEALCKGAAKAGYVPVVKIGRAIVSLVPEGHDAIAHDDSSVDRGKDIRL